MTKKLWVATSNVKANSNLYNYEKFISKKFNQQFNQNYRKILGWSIENLGNKIFELIVSTASGNKSKSEINGYGDEEFNPWQVGVVM